MRGPSLDVRFWRLKTVPELKGLNVETLAKTTSVKRVVFAEFERKKIKILFNVCYNKERPVFVCSVALLENTLG